MKAVMSCVNLVDRTAPSAIIDMAKEHNIPVIFFNRELVAEDLMQWDRLYYVPEPGQSSQERCRRTGSGRD